MESNSWRKHIINKTMKQKPMNQRHIKNLIKEYVSETLREDDGSMGYDDGGMGSGGYGGGGSGEDLFNTFIKPFADVVGTIAGKTKELARRGMTVLNVAFETLKHTLIPFLVDSYGEIFAKEQGDIQKIRGEYQKYYDSTEKVLGGADAKVLAFIAFPGAALTGKFVKTAPKAAKGILSIATGGLSDKYLRREGINKRNSPTMFDAYTLSYISLLREAGDNEKK